ncbi:AlbA family DNA-binding domain-containing protein [Peristeroidobacter soli]|uniref:AlbA family DNA-binding domain-containing protein n=1 Tax=Peristeroidobacter soli TaxID=2497877 RepID=UPI00101D250B|nr:ATP-binding protein [Peristeroidobacter soli]
MITTQRYLHSPADLDSAAKALDVYEVQGAAYVRVIYTRQQDADWRYCIGQCLLGGKIDGDARQDYPAFVFVSKAFNNITLKQLLEMLASAEGLEIAPDLPAVCLPATSPVRWREEIVPSHATKTGMPARRFRANVESNAVFSESQLIAFDQPYQPSAEHHAKAFLGLNPRDGLDRGEFTIEVADRRGAISFADGRIAITGAVVPVRLVGKVNGKVIDIAADAGATIDDRAITEVELWLLTNGNALIDFISTTHWPYKYAPTPQEAAREQERLALILGGESEICEFKPSVDLANDKASQLEKTVCAFSNQKGGTLFIGVSKEGEIEGVAGHAVRRGDDADSAIAAYAQAVRTHLREALKDNQCFEVKVASVADTQLVVVTVVKSPEINFLVKTKVAYIRHGGTSVKLTPQEMKSMIEVSYSQRQLL